MEVTVFLGPLQKWRRGGAPAPSNGVRISRPAYGGGDRITKKKGYSFSDPLQKWRRGGAPAPPNGVRISRPPYGGGDTIP